MKAIFEEYGFVALAAVVVLILITMASPIGEKIESSIETVIDNMTAQVSNPANINNQGK